MEAELGLKKGSHVVNLVNFPLGFFDDFIRQDNAAILLYVLVSSVSTSAEPCPNCIHIRLQAIDKSRVFFHGQRVARLRIVDKANRPADNNNAINKGLIMCR